MTAEETLIVRMDLPPGQDWAWFPDANLVGLARHLDEYGEKVALDELQVHWRRKCIRLVSGNGLRMPAETLRALG